MKRGLPITPKARKIVKERSQGRCEGGLRQYGCTGMGEELDHKKLRSRGGSNDPKNLQHLCRPCHRAKTLNKPGTEHLSIHSWEVEA